MDRLAQCVRDVGDGDARVARLDARQAVHLADRRDRGHNPDDCICMYVRVYA